MKKISSVVGIAALAFSTAVCADPTNTPMEQAVESIFENSVKNPGNPGLINVQERLIDNEARQADRGRNHAPGLQRVERAESVERVERPERPERPERVVRVERVEQVDRVGVDRVEQVDFAGRSDNVRGQRPERARGNGRR